MILGSGLQPLISAFGRQEGDTNGLGGGVRKYGRGRDPGVSAPSKLDETRALVRIVPPKEGHCKIMTRKAQVPRGPVRLGGSL